MSSIFLFAPLYYLSPSFRLPYHPFLFTPFNSLPFSCYSSYLFSVFLFRHPVPFILSFTFVLSYYSTLRTRWYTVTHTTPIFYYYPSTFLLSPFFMTSHYSLVIARRSPSLHPFRRPILSSTVSLPYRDTLVYTAALSLRHSIPIHHPVSIAFTHYYSLSFASHPSSPLPFVRFLPLNLSPFSHVAPSHPCTLGIMPVYT